RKWNLGTGDTDTSVLISPNKNYSNADSYSVKLISISNNNCIDSITKTINVNSNVMANFNINDSFQCLTGNSFVFTNSSTNSNSQTWSFGDASNSAVLSPTKTYNTTGNFVVKLVANNASNCTDSITKMVTVNAQPTIGTITGSNTPSSITTPFTYSILNQTNTNYSWSVINGTIQSGQGTNTIDVIWSITGTGSLKAKIMNSNSCLDSTILAVNITSVGVNEKMVNTFSSINFKPNPFTNGIEISFVSITKEITKLVIVNAVGKEVYAKNIQSNIGDNTVIIDEMAGLKSGIYFAHLENNNGFSQTVKLIKN
ncbi:MAG: PKD domain-containing protein, partial [Bacteroidota bacterium]